ncbi:YbaN family protein [Novosphingobium piscinae]|uniref:YbaN family protein n=1 Tax=Novosphingobium piscinae TaxID=1507448 RepID=A0A7X1FVZ2_9SPHN|nr:YbaN family protein [Novosphingobium piscinae]MBC2667999.1 YbaN family protein [Novosphingobium piscinae]
MTRPFWLVAGLLAVGLGILGIALPVLPTVPFFLLAAFCFARSNPVWEQRLLDHPTYGPPLRQWRARRAIPRRAKLAALTGMAASIAISAVFVGWPWIMAPVLVCGGSGWWIWTRPE